MKAIVQRGYGTDEVVSFEDVAVPVVGDHDVLVRVRAASLNAADWFTMIGKPYLIRAVSGLRTPRVPVAGKALSGEVVALGAQVSGFVVGDEIWAEPNGGAFAEYASIPAERVAHKPPSLTFEQAAAVPLAGTTALQGLRDVGRLHSGQSLLVNGASGGVGTFAVQLGKAFGAEVTGVCSTRNVELVRSVGADHVLDYTRDEFTGRYDVIFDLVGNHSLSRLRSALTERGTLVLSAGEGSRVFGPIGRIIRGGILSLITRHRLEPLVAKHSVADLDLLAEFVAAGSITPAIDRTYPLSACRDAVRRLGVEHARGKIVLVP
ncbi:NAD(P)-dependent alcohol dehydrogenase [Cellulomonas sp. URHD0024]|uniref:NAD(P)-dependent alcohol dehydrogenase n=1 Tax=Cellulomonas sp. URHD0024 TaxID=1302620 RepID=UPI0003F6F91F|nr:NAD(P)-dependent alcohol dehydrogenase [Cellulomonas sp. URHD0024]